MIHEARMIPLINRHGRLHMPIAATNENTLSGVICSVIALAASFTVCFGAGFNRTAHANAEKIDMSTFCAHYHNWALSGTTQVDSSPCPVSDTSSQNTTSQYDFCFHNHKFALNWTSIVVGDSGVEDWCSDSTKSDTPLTRDVFDFHYHNNAGTGTTGPIE